jgi:hypothetical protein
MNTHDDDGASLHASGAFYASFLDNVPMADRPYVPRAIEKELERLAKDSERDNADSRMSRKG